ncbi:hypothetical protein SESBI_13831 [Sesbania bispinosa]|nr:hypothetical protein SESBI_13831 [Sesbania bispinosa]
MHGTTVRWVEHSAVKGEREGTTARCRDDAPLGVACRHHRSTNPLIHGDTTASHSDSINRVSDPTLPLCVHHSHLCVLSRSNHGQSWPMVVVARQARRGHQRRYNSLHPHRLSLHRRPSSLSVSVG